MKLYNLVVIGEPEVGKTSLISSFISEQSQKCYNPTTGSSMKTCTVKINIDTEIKAQIYDMTTNDHSVLLTNVHLSSAHGIIIVYDITNDQTFNSCKNKAKKLLSCVNSHRIMMIVGNKLDNSDMRKVERASAELFAKQNACLFRESSAATGEGVKEVFEEIVLSIYKDGDRIFDRPKTNCYFALALTVIICAVAIIWFV
jgi:Ras-related protein Rab-1A